MARLDLKPFQETCLDRVRQFCDATREAGGVPAEAFRALTERAYVDVDADDKIGLRGVPYVCLRVPTGGGKTLIGTHAVGQVAQRLMREDAPLCLWVTPSTTIRDQTLRGLRDPGHPYGDALRRELPGRHVDVLTIEEALQSGYAFRPGNATVIVTTIQSYRIDDLDVARKVYEDNGYLMDASPAFAADRRIASSLANAVRLRRPIVVMDEAHNARTRISFESLARFGPAFVLELTATPVDESDFDREKFGSNVLHAVSALELSRPGCRMIKLPIELESRETWLDVLAATKAQREVLQADADALRARTGRYIRPIALVQAQARNRTRETITVDAVKKALVEQLGVPEERVRIVTGDVDEVGDEDVQKPESDVDYIVTVDKLREGWDCPFAYVLGSIGNVATPRAVEQLIGRVLRMPGATETDVASLDRAYAVVLSDDVLDTARNLERGLVATQGFDERTAADALRTPRTRETLDFGESIPVKETPPPAALPPAVRAKVVVEPERNRIRVVESLTQPEALALRDALTHDPDKRAVEAFWDATRAVGVSAKALGDFAPPLRVPQLSLSRADLPERSLYEPLDLDEYEWNLAGLDAALPAFDIAADVGERVTVDVTARGGVEIGRVTAVTQLTLGYAVEVVDEKLLIRWLDRELHRDARFAGLTAGESQAWLAQLIDGLVRGRGADVKVLGRKRHELADAVVDTLVRHGTAQLAVLAQQLIDGRTPVRLETSGDFAFELMEDQYVPGKEYRGDYQNSFKRHAFTIVGDMNGEEATCAKKIDDHPNVRRWVRNPSYASNGGFSLPLSPGRFFPDFVVELLDGRTALIEYKGANRATLAEELRKKTVGELWADRSGAACRFGWVVDKDWDALQKALEAR